tara:strand:+ start:1009 stop:1308 length:300 start_codon:yes stop_codon:yes gene_type:complete
MPDLTFTNFSNADAAADAQSMEYCIDLGDVGSHEISICGEEIDDHVSGCIDVHYVEVDISHVVESIHESNYLEEVVHALLERFSEDDLLEAAATYEDNN